MIRIPDLPARWARGGWPLAAVVAVAGVSFTATRPESVQEQPRAAASRPSGAKKAGLFVVGIDGNGLRVVARPDGFDRAAHPAWSPKGDRIAFTAFDATGRSPEIRVVPAAGGESVVVAKGVAPSWSADGTRIAYMASGKASVGVDWGRLGRNDERIEIVRLSGEKAGETEVVGPGLWPRFAPTDDRLAWIGRDRTSWDVYVRSADRLTLSRLTNDPAQDSQPIWRPDGSAVVFLSNRVNRWDLYECPATGGPIRRLTKHPRREDSPTLSPDGTRVAFTNETGRGQAHIQLLDLASETAVDLLPDPLDDREPCWSPDGQSIAFASRRTSPER